jgi:ketosteroid isomerase-like protein
MRTSGLAGLVFLVFAACASAPAALTTGEKASETAAITALLEAQDAAWNRGDIEGFMNGYWVSDDLRFASGGDVVRGYDSTLARYKVRYPGPEGMGTLTTTDYEIEILSADAAVAHGRWKVSRDGEELEGLYTLILRKPAGQWLIVSDTTTSAE